MVMRGPTVSCMRCSTCSRQPGPKMAEKTGPTFVSSTNPVTSLGSMSNPSPPMCASRWSRCNPRRHWMDRLPTSTLTLPPITCVTGCAAIPAFEYGGCYSWLLLVIFFLSIHEGGNNSIGLRLRVHKGVIAAWNAEYTIVVAIVFYSFYCFINTSFVGKFKDFVYLPPSLGKFLCLKSNQFNMSSNGGIPWNEWMFHFFPCKICR